MNWNAEAPLPLLARDYWHDCRFWQVLGNCESGRALVATAETLPIQQLVALPICSVPLDFVQWVETKDPCLQIGSVVIAWEKPILSSLDQTWPAIKNAATNSSREGGQVSQGQLGIGFVNSCGFGIVPSTSTVLLGDYPEVWTVVLEKWANMVFLHAVQWAVSEGDGGNGWQCHVQASRPQDIHLLSILFSHGLGGLFTKLARSFYLDRCSRKWQKPLATAKEWLRH